MEYSYNLPVTPILYVGCNKLSLSESYSVLRTNYYPDPSELSRIQAFINLNKEDIEQAQRFIELQCSLISPIRKLPEEILIEILRHAIVAHTIDDDNFGGIDIGSKSGIWSIREVCARWQSIVDKTPTFWKTFYYSSDYTKVPSKCRTARTKLCLRLSRSELLKVSLTPGYGKCHPLGHELQEILTHASRLQALAIDIHVIFNVEDWKSKCNSVDFGQLRKLYMVDSCCESYPSGNIWCYSCPFKFFQNATELEDVELEGTVLDDALELPWSNVTTLGMASFYRTKVAPEEFRYTLLSRIPHLEKLSWGRDRRHSSLHSIPDEMVTLPSLRSLEVHSIGKFWSTRASVPLLTSLRVFSDECFDSNNFTTMLQQSGCNLKSIEMTLLPDLALGALPVSLEELKLVIPYPLSDECIKTLQYLSFHQSQLLPCLKKLTLHWFVIEPEQLSYAESIVEATIDIMKSRSPEQLSSEMSQLSTIRCDMYYCDKLSCLTRLEAVGKKLGVNVEVDYNFVRLKI